MYPADTSATYRKPIFGQSQTMIINHRTYTIVPRKMGPYLALVESHGLPVMLKHGFELMG